MAYPKEVAAVMFLIVLLFIFAHGSGTVFWDSPVVNGFAALVYVPFAALNSMLWSGSGALQLALYAVFAWAIFSALGTVFGEEMFTLALICVVMLVLVGAVPPLF